MGSQGAVPSGTGNSHGCGGSPGALIGCVGAHRRWPVSICVLSNQTQICLNRARPVELRLARWLDMGGGMQRGPQQTHRGNFAPSSGAIHPLWPDGATPGGGSKNMAIAIASEPSWEFSLIIYSGGESLTPTHARPISRVVAKQRASAAITRRAPPPAARPSPWRSRSSSRWPCAVPACWLFAPCMYLGRRIRQPSQFTARMPLRARVCDLAFAPSCSSHGPIPMVVGPCPPKSAD